ncbi:MAG: tocopherol cyclase family protein [Crocinitomicaceae bacterium]
MKKYILLLCVFVIYLTKSAHCQLVTNDNQFSEHKTLPFYSFKKRNNTALFQGNKKRNNYFEGWYFKMVSANGNSIISVIPGISLADESGNQHAFIQLINGVSSETYYYSFPIEDFYFSKKDFIVRIGENYFSEDSLRLNLDDGKHQVTAKVHMTNQTPFVLKRKKKAIMGWYRFVPFMQCYHGVVSLSHQLSGKITINSTEHHFQNGKGYLEKDWGSSMPEAWIWMQSNHFNNRHTSFMLSVATIPWLGKTFTGFLGFLLYEGKIYRFATYTNSELAVEMLNKNQLKIEIRSGEETILVKATSKRTGELKAPSNGAMNRRIAESIDASIHISLLNKFDTEIYSDSSSITGLEMVGDINYMISSIK